MLEYHDFMLIDRDEANEAARLSHAPADESYEPSGFSLVRNNNNTIFAAYDELGAVLAAAQLNEHRGFDVSGLLEKAKMIQAFINCNDSDYGYSGSEW